MVKFERRNMGIWSCFIPFLAMIAVQTVMLILLSGVFTAKSNVEDGMGGIILLFIIRVIHIVLFGYWYFRLLAKNNYKNTDAKGREGIRGILEALMRNAKEFLTTRNLIIIIFVGIYIQIGGAYLLTYILQLFPRIYEEYAAMLTDMTAISIWTFLYIAIASPIAEELIFRGVILKYAKDNAPFIIANILQAALFGVFHGNIIQGIYAFLLGMVIGYIYYLSGSVIPCVIVHMSVNISGLYLDKILPEDLPEVVKVSLMLTSIGIIVFCIRKLLKEKENKDTRGRYE